MDGLMVKYLSESYGSLPYIIFTLQLFIVKNLFFFIMIVISGGYLALMGLAQRPDIFKVTFVLFCVLKKVNTNNN